MAAVQSAGSLLTLPGERPADSPLLEVHSAWGGVGFGPSHVSPEMVWRTQPNVRTVTGFLARNVADVDVKTYRRKSDTDRARLADHPVQAVLDSPNVAMTGFELRQRLMMDLALYDVALWWTQIEEATQTAMIVPIPPAWAVPKGGTFLMPEVWDVRVPMYTGFVRVPADEVIVFPGYDPATFWHGYSPMHTIGDLLEEGRESARYRRQMWRSAWRMSSVVTRPPTAPPWGEPERKRFVDGMLSLYGGNGPQAGGVPILEDGMTLTPVGFSPKDAEYIAARKLTREEVAAAFHVPPPLVGILDHATYSNITEQHKSLYQDTLGPWLKFIEGRLTKSLVARFADRDNVYCEFDLGTKLRGDFEQQATAIQLAVGRPIMTPNEARARINLPAIDGGDELVTPLNMLRPGGDPATATDAGPPAPATRARGGKARRLKARGIVAPRVVDAAEAALKRHFGRQRDVLASKLGAKGRTKDALDDAWDDDRWDGELADELMPVNTATAAHAARYIADAYGAEWDPDTVDHWLRANADGVAAGINGTTKGQLRDALAGPEDDRAGAIRHVFEVAIAARAAQIAVSQVTSIAGFGAEEGAKAAGLPSKAWVVTSANPRPTHAAMDGETVTVGDTFSNGARWPGDSTLDEDERAGCTCELDFTEA